MKKKLIRIALGLFLLLLVVAGSAFWYISRSGSGKLEQWIQSQLLTIANSYLNPKLSFTDLDYTYPFTVSIKNLKLTADDPANPGKAIDMIACGGASITLGEIPSVGKPIIIEKISLDKPLISAVATAAGSKEFVGFSNLIRPGAITPSTDQPKPADAPSKLSDVFRMRLVQLIDGKIIYDPRIAGTVPMSLDQINTTLAIEPTSQGWYKLNFAVARKPVFDVIVLGELDLDTFTVHNADIKLLADLGSDKLDYLPPELQQIIKQYDGKGKLTVAITGTMPATDPMKGQIQANVTLSSAHVAMGDFKLPIENVDLSAKFADGKADLTSLKIAALGGTADLSGSATLNDRLDADLSLNVSGMVLENLLKSGPGPNAAKLDLNFKVAGSLMAILGKIPGASGQPLGAISLRDFRLSAPDPANPRQTLDVVAVKNLDISLTEPVTSGKPIVIDKIILDHPTLSAVAVAPNSMQFVGVPNLPPSVTTPAKASSAPEPGLRNPAPASSKLSDLIRVKTFQLVGAKIIYDPRLPNTQRMWLDDINTSIKLDPADPGVYVLDASIARKPVFDISAGARINIDRPGVENLKLNLLADLTQGQMDFLVPQLQVLLKESRATGKLTFSAAGNVPFGDLGKAKLHAESALENVSVVANGEKAPVDGFKFNADIAGGKLTINNLSVAAVGSTFNLTGGVVLSDRMDSEIILHIAGLPIEKVLAAVKQGTNYNTQTLLDADVQVKAAIGVALSGLAGKPGEPTISLTVKNFHLTTDDAGDNPLQFVSCDSLAVSLSSLPVGGKPIVIDRVVVDRPTIKAVAFAAGSSDLVGFANLQKIAAAGAPATQPAGAAPTHEKAPAGPPTKLSSLFRLSQLAINDASLYYDPKVAKTVPMSIQHLNVTLAPDTDAGDVYTLAVTTPAAPEFSLAVGSKVNIDALAVTDLKLNLFADLAKRDAGYLPPQLQAPLNQYDVEGALNIEVTGGVPMTDPTSGNVLAMVRLDSVKATAADYRIPVNHVRIPVQLKDKQLQILPASTAGGPMVELLDGTVDLTGKVLLDSVFTAPKLDLIVKDVQLQRLSEVKLHKDPKSQDLIGLTNAEVHLVNAPLLSIVAAAAPPDPKVPPTTLPVLPDDWGSGQVRITDARLAGLELVQGLGNLAKSALASVFERDKAAGPSEIKPKEKANIDFKLAKHQIVFEKAKIYYEGEVVAVEGSGTVDLNGKLDLKLRGGPWGKLGNVGPFGKWVSDTTSSLLNYTVTGSPTDAKYPTIGATTGDGKQVIDGVTNLAEKGKESVEKGVDVTKEGLKKAGGLIDSLFNKKDK